MEDLKSGYNNIDQTTQPPSQISPPPVETKAPTPPPTAPEPAKPNNWLIISLVILVVLLSLGAAGVFAYKNYQLTHQLTPSQTTPLPTPTPTEGMKCVEKSSLNCTDIVELTFECSDQYQSWARANCPGWQERVECPDPRPEVCTMECAQTPPYICGSDGNSYCSACQACSNKDVIWYEMKASACEEGLVEDIPLITDSELSLGWYYGTKDQKKPYTPANWIYTEAGRSSCWHKSDTQCGLQPY